MVIQASTVVEGGAVILEVRSKESGELTLGLEAVGQEITGKHVAVRKTRSMTLMPS